MKNFTSKSFVIELGDHKDRHYQLNDKETGRRFAARRSIWLDDQHKEGYKFFLEEFVITPRMVELDLKGYAIDGWIEPIIADAMTRVKPNELQAELDRLGIFDNEKTAIVRDGGGYGAGSIFYASLDECATVINQCINDNISYKYYRELSPQEKTKLEQRQSEHVNDYWLNKKKILDLSLKKDDGIFKGCFTMMGVSLDEQTKKTILSFINEPTNKKWLDIRGLVVVDHKTLWQLWCDNDQKAPRHGEIGFPKPEVLIESIRTGVDKLVIEIDEKLKVKAKKGLKLVKTNFTI